MYTMVADRPVSELLTHRLPALVGAMLVAESCYRLHSFLLECTAFLVTWFVLDWMVARVTDARGAK